MEPFITVPWTNLYYQQLIRVSSAYLPLMAFIVLFCKVYFGMKPCILGMRHNRGRWRPLRFTLIPIKVPLLAMSTSFNSRKLIKRDSQKSDYPYLTDDDRPQFSLLDVELGLLLGVWRDWITLLHQRGVSRPGYWTQV